MSNLFRLRLARCQCGSALPSEPFAPLQPLGSVRPDVDLLFDALAGLLAQVGSWAPHLVAWLQHENACTLVHHPLDVVAAMSWAGAFFLLSLTARMTARGLRRLGASHRSND